jgi:hypothetical protein
MMLDYGLLRANLSMNIHTISRGTTAVIKKPSLLYRAQHAKLAFNGYLFKGIPYASSN